MKNLLLILVTLALFAAGQCFAQSNEKIDSKSTSTAENSLAEVSWNTEAHDFGDVQQGTPVSFDFQLTNTGSEPLIITNVKASCGCTATNYPKSPVQPGETAQVTATYNAKSKGSFNKTLTVYTNTKESVKVLRIKGMVL